MIHPDRIFSFKELAREEDLIEAMINHKWPICYGFYYGNLLYFTWATGTAKMILNMRS